MIMPSQRNIFLLLGVENLTACTWQCNIVNAELRRDGGGSDWMKSFCSLESCNFSCILIDIIYITDLLFVCLVFWNAWIKVCELIVATTNMAGVLDFCTISNMKFCYDKRMHWLFWRWKRRWTLMKNRAVVTFGESFRYLYFH